MFVCLLVGWLVGLGVGGGEGVGWLVGWFVFYNISSQGELMHPPKKQNKTKQKQKQYKTKQKKKKTQFYDKGPMMRYLVHSIGLDPLSISAK